jgi:predicted adenylyl cyclase CyaB
MKELEVLVKIEEPEAEVWKKIKQGFGNGITDTYFNYPKIVLRVRDDENGLLLTYKKDFYRGKRWLDSKEYESFVDISIFQLLPALGYKPTIRINMIKYYCKNGIEIQKVKGLGLFLEVEGKNRKEIWARIKKTGIKVSKELNKGKPQLMWEK